VPQIGEVTTPTLTVDPFDATTDATLTVYMPDGQTDTPSTNSDDDGATWTAADVVYDTAGWWAFEWNVTGMGAGAQTQRVYVGPVDALPPNLLPIYVSLEEFKDSAKIPATETTRDDLILKRIRAASRAIDDAAGRRFWLDDTATARTFSARGNVVRTEDGDLFLIDDLGAAPTLVETGAGGSYSTVAASAYETNPDNALVRGWPVTGLLRLNSSWPKGGGYRLRVTGRWGWPRIPDPIEQATQILAARLFKRKDSPEGVMGSSDMGFIRMARTDPDVAELIRPYLLPGIA
jgi:hypothetical protein